MSRNMSRGLKIFLPMLVITSGIGVIYYRADGGYQRLAGRTTVLPAGAANSQSSTDQASSATCTSCGVLIKALERQFDISIVSQLDPNIPQELRAAARAVEEWRTRILDAQAFAAESWKETPYGLFQYQEMTVTVVGGEMYALQNPKTSMTYCMIGNIIYACHMRVSGDKCYVFSSPNGSSVVVALDGKECHIYLESAHATRCAWYGKKVPRRGIWEGSCDAPYARDICHQLELLDNGVSP